MLFIGRYIWLCLAVLHDVCIARAYLPRVACVPAWHHVTSLTSQKPVPARHPAGPPTPAEQGAGRETWSGHAGPPGASSGPRRTPACSVAIRRPGPLLLLLPPVSARHPAGPPTPAEHGAGRETRSGHAGPPGASSGRAAPLLARWQPGAQGPCSCCCHPCRHGTRLARRRRQSKGAGQETWSGHTEDRVFRLWSNFLTSGDLGPYFNYMA